MYYKSKVTSKSQITIPKKIREALKIKPGDEVVFEKKDDKVIVSVERESDPVSTLIGLVQGGEKELRKKAVDRMLKKKLGQMV